MAMNQIQFQAGMSLPEFRSGFSPSTGRVREKEILQRTIVVAAKFAELGDKLPARLRIRWESEAANPLDLSVHNHVGKAVGSPPKLSASAQIRNTQDTRIGQDYQWIWRNTSTAPAALSSALRRR